MLLYNVHVCTLTHNIMQWKFAFICSCHTMFYFIEILGLNVAGIVVVVVNSTLIVVAFDVTYGTIQD